MARAAHAIEVVAFAKGSVERHIGDIIGRFSPQLAAPAEGWPAAIRNGGDAPGDDPGARPAFLSSVAGEAVGEDALASTRASRTKCPRN